MMSIRLSSWSLRAKMGAVLVLTSILPLMVSAYSDVREAREQLVATMSGLLAARSDQLAEKIDSLNDWYVRSAAKFARLPEIAAYCAQGPHPTSEAATLAQSALIAHPAEDPRIEASAILTMQGFVAVATRDDLVGKDLSRRPFVQRALRGEGVASDIYVEESGGREWPAIAYLHPVRGPQGDLSGVMILWLRAEALWQMAKASNALAGPGSFAVLFNEQGIRIAHTYKDDFVFRPAGRLASSDAEALILEGRFGKRTAELLDEVHDFPEQFDRARAAHPDPKLFMAFAPVNRRLNYGVARRLKTQPWTLFYMIPKMTVDDQIAAMMRERLLFGAAIVLAALLLGLGASRAVVQPIHSLSAATERLGRGDLGARVALVERNDELGKLVESFNTMAARIESQSVALSDAREKLEQRVADRTAELTETARMLEAEIVERRRTEIELKKSQAQFSALGDAGVIGLIKADMQGRVIEINATALSIVGYSRAEVMAPDFSWSNLTPADWKRGDDLARVELSSGGVVRPREKEYLRKDGQRIPVLIGVTSLKEAPNEVVAFVLDLSERRRAEATLTRLRQTEASEAKFRGLLEAAPDAIVIIKDDGKIAIVNAQAEEMFGYTRQELIGEPVELLVPRRFADAHVRNRSDYFKEPRARRMGAGLELLGVRRDGHEFPIEISLSPMNVAEGLLVSAAIRDVTERKRTADALARAKEETEVANRELEAFSYSVAHDLRAPLRGMNGFAHILLDSYRDRLDADGQDWLNEIVLNAEKMGTLIDALLSLARVTRSELRLQTVDLSKIAREVASQLASTEPERNVDWAIEGGVLADADPTLARAVLENLLANAWKFTAKAAGTPHIELGSSERDGERVYYVRDNGAGFDMSYSSKLFAPFQRLHTADEFPGTGIGLATVQRIAQRHGGRVWAEGAVNEGATFFFTLSSRTGAT